MFGTADQTTSDGYTLICANAKCQDYMNRRMDDHSKYATEQLCKATSNRLQRKLSFLRIGKFCYIFPFVEGSHYFTIVLRLDTESLDFGMALDIYDSIRVSSRRSKKISPDSSHGSSLNLICSFLNTFVFYSCSSFEVKVDLEYLLSNANHRLCPQQKNGIDCGLFTAGVSLHLLYGVELLPNSFLQKSMSGLRADLDDGLRLEFDSNGMERMPGHIIRFCFPKLHEAIGEDPEEDGSDVEVVGYKKGAIIVKVEDGYNSDDSVLCLGTSVKDLLLQQEEERKEAAATTQGKVGKREFLEKKGNGGDKVDSTEVPVDSKGGTGGGDESTVEKKEEQGDQKSLRKSTLLSKKKLKTASERGRNLKNSGRNMKEEESKKNDSNGSWKPPETGGKRPPSSKRTKKGTGDRSQNYHVCEEFLSVIAKYWSDDMTFSSFDVISNFISDYEHLKGIQLCITRSESKKMYRNYECVTHEGCPFHINFGPRRRNGAIMMKSYDTTHYGAFRKPTAKGGRKWKKRRKDLLDDVCGTVEQNKASIPVAADVQKSSATNLGKVVNYNQAWRALEESKKKKFASRKKNYELLPNYLLKLGELNEGSTIDCVVNKNTHELRRLFICPSYINDIYCCLRPVISTDAAHLKGFEGGTIEAFAMYTGNKELYILGFGITSGTENAENWRYEFRHLRSAIPVLQNKRTDTLEDDEEEDNDTAQIREIEATSHDTLFVVDRMKGIDTALKETFPQHHMSNCGKHIAANVEQKFGKRAASLVQPIGKTFSTRHEESLLDQLRKTSPNAYNYVNNIDPKLWRGTTFNEYDHLPARFGITTSNASEQFNSWIEEERNQETWLGVVETVVEKMCKNISTKRQLYKDKPPNEVVPWVKQVLVIKFNAAASMKVYQIKEDTAEFCVTEANNQFLHQDEAIHFGTESNITSTIMKSRQHLVLPKKASCTCGKWQDMKFPCRHGVGYFRLWEDLSLQMIEDKYVHYYSQYKALQKLYKPNICPVSSDTIKFDEVTKPPTAASRSSGRPKKKRIRNRSKFVDPKNSNISCSKCGAKGHNMRTCLRRQEIMKERQAFMEEMQSLPADATSVTNATRVTERNVARMPEETPIAEETDTDETETVNSVQTHLKDDAKYEE